MGAEFIQQFAGDLVGLAAGAEGCDELVVDMVAQLGPAPGLGQAVQLRLQVAIADGPVFRDAIDGPSKCPSPR